MKVDERYRMDFEFLLGKKHHLGGDLWTTPDNRIGKGSPFSARDVAIILPELGISPDEQIAKELSCTLFANLREDGRFRMAPGMTIYPCHTMTIFRVLCGLGYYRDRRLNKTIEYLLKTRHSDGGWRCNRTKMGRSDQTDASNPGVTLEALDALRYFPSIIKSGDLDAAVEFLLAHWETRKPLGPCHFGIGTRFLQVEFPFMRYNLFYYCYVLSFYQSARSDLRFTEVYNKLESKLVDGQMVIEHTNRGLAKMEFCRKGCASGAATRRFVEIRNRINRTS